MPLPLPRNCRFDKSANIVYFTVDIDGLEWRASIACDAISKLYGASEDPIRTISQSSHIATAIGLCIADGNDGEPIHLASTMFDDEGRLKRVAPWRD